MVDDDGIDCAVLFASFFRAHKDIAVRSDPMPAVMCWFDRLFLDLLSYFIL